MTEIKPFNPQDAVDLFDESKRAVANLNQAAGPGYSVFLDKKLIACGGVRIYGVGELWILQKEAQKNIKPILRASKEQIDLMIRENHLWRIIAETKSDFTWLKHLGFAESKKKLFTR